MSVNDLEQSVEPAVTIQEMTQAEYSRHRGVSRVAIHKAIAAGKIPFRVEAGRKLIDPAAADHALGVVNAQRVLANEPLQQGGRQGGSLTTARTATEIYRARLAQLEYNERLGKLRPVEDFTIAAQVCGEIAVRAINNITRRADEIVAAVRKDGAAGARGVLRAIARDLRVSTAEAFAKLAAGEVGAADEEIAGEQ
jgi:hypothetical protein